MSLDFFGKILLRLEVLYLQSYLSCKLSAPFYIKHVNIFRLNRVSTGLLEQDLYE